MRHESVAVDMNALGRDLTGLFVGCDCNPGTATCSFHDGTCSLGPGDVLQLEVERIDGCWTPLFHRCPAHATDQFPPAHAVEGLEQALVRVTLSATGAHLPESGQFAPDALTVSDVEVLDWSSPVEGKATQAPQRDD